jgi:hypothetical protein
MVISPELDPIPASSHATEITLAQALTPCRLATVHI